VNIRAVLFRHAPGADGLVHPDEQACPVRLHGVLCLLTEIKHNADLVAVISNTNLFYQAVPDIQSGSVNLGGDSWDIHDQSTFVYSERFVK
jgi:hypothetical protein